MMLYCIGEEQTGGNIGECLEWVSIIEIPAESLKGNRLPYTELGNAFQDE